MRARVRLLAGALGFALCAAITAACSSSGDPGPAGSGGGGGVPGSSGAAGVGPGGVPVTGAGGTSAGGVTSASGAPGGGGVMNLPPGQLTCAGKLCKGGGHCATDGSCPAFLGDCFTQTDNFVSCDSYCQAKGSTCAASSCNADGTALMGGYTWVSYAAASLPKCQMSAYPDTSSFDMCSTPIWLSATKNPTDVIRCCCKA